MTQSKVLLLCSSPNKAFIEKVSTALSEANIESTLEVVSLNFSDEGESFKTYRLFLSNDNLTCGMDILEKELVLNSIPHESKDSLSFS
jgi:hypothetical protein